MSEFEHARSLNKWANFCNSCKIMHLESGNTWMRIQWQKPQTGVLLLKLQVQAGAADRALYGVFPNSEDPKSALQIWIKRHCHGDDHSVSIAKYSTCLTRLQPRDSGRGSWWEAALSNTASQNFLASATLPKVGLGCDLEITFQCQRLANKKYRYKLTSPETKITG